MNGRDERPDETATVVLLSLEVLAHRCATIGVHRLAAKALAVADQVELQWIRTADSGQEGVHPS